MATLALGALGAWLAPAGYAALGFSIGSALGGSLFAPDLPTIEGPRLSDLKIQSSNYGDMLPIVYGTARMAGKMIWSRPILETRHSEDAGGKGGPSQEVVSYTYSQTFAIAICEGEIDGVRRIWANGELIYNLGSDAPASAVYASNQSASGITIYTGSETQLPDSLIQAFEGAANTPAYRGTAYVVFNNLQLAKFGNRTPNLEFEVVATGTNTSPYIGTSFPASLGLEYGRVADGVAHVSSGSTSLGGGFYKVNHNVYSLDGVFLGDNSYVSFGQLTISQNDPDFCAGITSFATFYQRGIPVGTYVSNLFGSSITLYGTVKHGLMRASSLSGTAWDFLSIVNGVGVSLLNLPKASVSLMPTVGEDGRIYLAVSGTLNAYDENFTVQDSWSTAGMSQPGTTSYMTVVGGVMMLSGSEGGAVTSTAANRLNNDGTMTSLGKEETTFSGVHIQAGPYLALNNPYPIIFDPKVVSPGSVALSTIISKVCERVDLAAGNINVTGITDNCDGYVISRRMSARAAIEPLMTAFFFDGVESDGKIKFVKRGGSVDAAIIEDDLAAQSESSSSGNSSDAIRITRGQEMELPSEVTVSYIDKDAGYQTGTQSSRRLTSSSKKTLDLQLAVSMTAARAKQIADVALYVAWTGRNATPLSTDRSYQHLEPTSLILATQGNLTWLLRLVTKNERDGIIEWQAVAEDISVYSQTGASVGLPPPSLTISMPGPTQLRLLDIPLLRDGDDSYGFYVAASGYLDGWTGAQLYKSSDNGASWQLVGNGILNAAIQGYASILLGNFTGGNTFDEQNSVTVIVNGELSSITELAVLNGGNAVLIGSEVLQFKNAELTATNTYKLTGLLRGRRGTEWAMTTHAIGDAVVLLTSTTVYRIDSSSAELNLERDWRAVSFGGYLDQAENHEFTNTAVGLECYSPVQIGGGRDASNNLTIKWVRRTRIGGEWRDYVDAQLGESAESYEVEIMNGGTVVRTISGLSSPTTPYSAADQTTDFGSPQASVSVKIYQLSTAVGRGYPGTATI